jgi:hypothetical protein
MLTIAGAPDHSLTVVCDSTEVVGGFRVWEIARQVDVRRADVVLPETDPRCCDVVGRYLRQQRALGAFPSLAMIRGYSEDGTVLRQCLTQALVDSAKAKDLPWESLARCLDPSHHQGLQYIPVAAYLANAESSAVWIIDKRTAIKAFNKTGFVAFRVKDGSVLCAGNSS